MSQWDSSGCNSTFNATTGVLHCSCNHLTDFAAFFESLLPPFNVVNVFDLSDVTVTAENSIPLALVSSVVGAYVLFYVLLSLADLRQRRAMSTALRRLVQRPDVWLAEQEHVFAVQKRLADAGATVPSAMRLYMASGAVGDGGGADAVCVGDLALPPLPLRLPRRSVAVAVVSAPERASSMRSLSTGDLQELVRSSSRASSLSPTPQPGAGRAASPLPSPRAASRMSKLQSQRAPLPPRPSASVRGGRQPAAGLRSSASVGNDLSTMFVGEPSVSAHVSAQRSKAGPGAATVAAAVAAGAVDVKAEVQALAVRVKSAGLGGRGALDDGVVVDVLRRLGSSVSPRTPDEKRRASVSATLRDAADEHAVLEPGDTSSGSGSQSMSHPHALVDIDGGARVSPDKEQHLAAGFRSRSSGTSSAGLLSSRPPSAVPLSPQGVREDERARARALAVARATDQLCALGWLRQASMWFEPAPVAKDASPDVTVPQAVQREFELDEPAPDVVAERLARGRQAKLSAAGVRCCNVSCRARTRVCWRRFVVGLQLEHPWIAPAIAGSPNHYTRPQRLTVVFVAVCLRPRTVRVAAGVGVLRSLTVWRSSW